MNIIDSRNNGPVMFGKVKVGDTFTVDSAVEDTSIFMKTKYNGNSIAVRLEDGDTYEFCDYDEVHIVQADIVDNMKTGLVKCDDVKIGSTFIFEGEIFIKIRETDCYTAVKLSDGTLYEFYDEAVKVVDADVVINY